MIFNRRTVFIFIYSKMYGNPLYSLHLLTQNSFYMKITNLLKLMIAVLVISVFSSCCQDINCGTGRVSVIGFINFDTAEINSTIVRRFPMGASYQIQNKIDSFKLGKYSTLSLIAHDTTNMTIVDAAPFHLSPGFKYQLYIPSVPDSLTIDRIVDRQSQLQACSGTEFSAKSCDNPIDSIKVNGAPVSNSTSYQIIYFTR